MDSKFDHRAAISMEDITHIPAPSFLEPMLVMCSDRGKEKQSKAKLE